LHLLNQLLPDELKFGVRTYVERDRYYYMAAHGENATKLKRLLAVTAPSAGGGYLSDKFKEFMKDARVDVRLDNIRLTPSGLVAADLTISEGGAAVKYYVYLQNSILLDFQSTDRSRAELAARLLRLAGVSAEVSKAGNRGVWRVVATTDMLAAGREELRNALAEIVRKAVERGWMDEKKAEFWLKKLERGRTVREGLPKYLVRLDKGALEVTFGSPNPNSITRETQRLKEMGLVEDWHFTVKMPEEDRDGYLYIPREGLAYAAWLSVYGSEKQRELATKFVSYILERAREEGDDVYEKVREVVEEGKARGSLTLKGFEKRVEVEGREHVVKVIDGGAEFDVGRSGKTLLRIRITAEVDGIRSEYTITYGRSGAGNAAVGYAVAKASAPGGREADAERFSALVEALTGKRPGVYRTRDGKIEMMCYGEHLEGFRRYAELTDAIEKWLRETRR
jgi:hypothetical protein